MTIVSMMTEKDLFPRFRSNRTEVEVRFIKPTPNQTSSREPRTTRGRAADCETVVRKSDREFRFHETGC